MNPKSARNARIICSVNLPHLQTRATPGGAGWRYAPTPLLCSHPAGAFELAPLRVAQTGEGSFSAGFCAHWRHQRGISGRQLRLGFWVPLARPSIAGLGGTGRRSRARHGCRSVHRQAMDGLSMDPNKPEKRRAPAQRAGRPGAPKMSAAFGGSSLRKQRKDTRPARAKQ